MNYKKYRADPDVLVKWVTNFVIGVALFLFAAHVFFPATMANESKSVLYIFFPLLFLIWGIHPIYYSVTASSIKVKRPFGSLEFHFDNIQDVKRIMPVDLGFSYRLFASGGLFGYLGFFSSNKIGRYMMCGTNHDEMILITCNDRKVVISPTDAGSFANEYFFKSKEYYSTSKPGVKL